MFDKISPVRLLYILKPMYNLSLNKEINPDPELDPLLDHKLLRLDDREVLCQVHGDILPSFDDQGERLHDDLPRIFLINYHSSGTSGSRA